MKTWPLLVSALLLRGVRCGLTLFRAALLLGAAGFIFGGNERRESVAMTSPVRTERVGGSEQIAMTSPVRTERSDAGAYRVSFVMPRKFTLDTLPAPRDARVHLREVPAHVAAAVWFTGGVADAEAMERWSATLGEELRAAGLTPEGPARDGATAAVSARRCRPRCPGHRRSRASRRHTCSP